MTVVAGSGSEAPSRGVEGILSVLVGMFFFVGQDVLMKELLSVQTIWNLIFARSVMAVLVLVPLILWLGRPHRLFSPLWPLHALRAFLFAFGFACFYTAFPFMGLAEVSTIFFSAPLIIAVMAVVLLGEKVGLHRLGALLVGFAGVVIALNPFGAAFNWIAILPLLCAVTYAGSQVLARRIGDRDSTLTVGLYTVVLAGVFVQPGGWALNQLIAVGPEFPHLRFDLSMPSGRSLVLMVILGTVGMIGYVLISRAYQIASASLIAPFDYSYLPMAAATAYFLWGEVPGTGTLVGMGMIIVSGLYLGYREVVSSKAELSPPPVAEAIIAPGNPVADMGPLSDTFDD